MPNKKRFLKYKKLKSFRKFSKMLMKNVIPYKPTSGDAMLGNKKSVYEQDIFWHFEKA